MMLNLGDDSPGLGPTCRLIAEALGAHQEPCAGLVQTAEGLGDNGLWRIEKLNGILYMPDVGLKKTSLLLCLRWYFPFKLSYRDLVAISDKRVLSISHSTILRWVVRYADTCEKRWHRFERPMGGSWGVDETFIKVRG